MQSAKYKKTDVILVPDPSDATRYIVYGVTGASDPNDDLPSYAKKNDRAITMININRLGPKELRAYCKLLQEEVVALVDFLNEDA